MSLIKRYSKYVFVITLKPYLASVTHKPDQHVHTGSVMQAPHRTAARTDCLMPLPGGRTVFPGFGWVIVELLLHTEATGVLSHHVTIN